MFDFLISRSGFKSKKNIWCQNDRFGIGKRMVPKSRHVYPGDISQNVSVNSLFVNRYTAGRPLVFLLRFEEAFKTHSVTRI